MTSQFPQVLAGRYEIRDLIGRGGMAEVHLGYDTRLSRVVAIKLLRSDIAGDPTFQARFRREAQSAAALNHPAVVAVYDSGEEELLQPGGASRTAPYIVMEYVEGPTLRDLIAAGMDVARFNFSHGSHVEHAARMERLRAVCHEVDSPCAVLLDTRGPEIRTGRLAGGAPVQLASGNRIVLTEAQVEGTAQRVSHTCPGLADVVAPGTSVLIDDGLIELRVDATEGSDILCTVLNAGMLGERKSVNLPGTSVPLPVMTDQDRDDLLFGVRQEVDFVAASFVRDARGVREIRDFLDQHGGAGIMLIAKIECSEAVENIEEILEAADGIMIARGDLGVEVPAYRVPHIQKEIIRACNRASKPAITATQMLDSMMEHPVPTRAEVSDIFHAVYHGASSIMLTGETAAGKYPREAMKYFSETAKSALVCREEVL